VARPTNTAAAAAVSFKNSDRPCPLSDLKYIICHCGTCLYGGPSFLLRIMCVCDTFANGSMYVFSDLQLCCAHACCVLVLWFRQSYILQAGCQFLLAMAGCSAGCCDVLGSKRSHAPWLCVCGMWCSRERENAQRFSLPCVCAQAYALMFAGPCETYALAGWPEFNQGDLRRRTRSACVLGQSRCSGVSLLNPTPCLPLL
jgi:hypothetical protein